MVSRTEREAGLGGGEGVDGVGEEGQGQAEVHTSTVASSPVGMRSGPTGVYCSQGLSTICPRMSPVPCVQGV